MRHILSPPHHLMIQRNRALASDAQQANLLENYYLMKERRSTTRQRTATVRIATTKKMRAPAVKISLRRWDQRNGKHLVWRVSAAAQCR
jgi:hypothetical protein